MRLLVCGGRDFTDAKRLYDALDRIHAARGITCVIAGAARGADKLAAAWANSRGVALEEYEADWNTLGKRAGPVRNTRMLVEGKPDGGLAFDTGGPGTLNMVNQMFDSGLPHSVIRVLSGK